ncbi:LacI family DNA-binding transcriptional regulator [Saccharibacillus sp. CPCC 101409]|uniref:LacI family DNA-binding transcriptional regulator n=1 Tax=Saccharibacillus sp. CPCC 101409 TaxID=3058041 RepID=UPI002672BB91|nr:LacI family DNA-binding transcriptional regulator [Saccharibacillus sp. CPCC 101409]MDO3411715.1 LacI family DNA-binding transcriptional regulator [Saccharibacillus sp. CPCC 101409]
MANIKDIARIAGVSITTVSRVINGHPYVSESKREAVLRAMKEADYERNINAVHLIKGRTGLIGIMVPSIKRPYFALVVEGIAEEALRRGYKLVLIQTDYEEERELEALRMLKHKQIDGLIVCSKTSGWSAFETYLEYGPIVAFEDARGSRVPSIFIDHYRAFTEALDYLWDKGHRRIGFCLARRSGTSSRQRIEAYRDFLIRKRRPFEESCVFDDTIHVEDGGPVVERLLDMQHPPTALLVTSDQVAAGILARCRELELEVPRRLALVAFDDQPLARVLGITTFAIPLQEIGAKLFRQVLEGGAGHTEIPVRMIERGTV